MKPSVKGVLSQIIALQTDMLLGNQGVADHLNALANTLFAYHRNDGLEVEVKKQVAQQQIESRVRIAKIQEALEKIRQAIAQIPE